MAVRRLLSVTRRPLIFHYFPSQTRLTSTFGTGKTYKYCFVEMVKPGGKGDTKYELLDFYIQTLAKVVGSAAEAKKKIYTANCGGKLPLGFGCNIDWETSDKLKGLPCVSHVWFNFDIDFVKKDYQGEFLFINGEIFQMVEVPLPMRSSISQTSGINLLSRVTPWLLLPPPAFGYKKVYRFYSLLDRKEVIVDNKFLDDAKFVGSSHGWLALFNPRNCDLYLSNPLSGRHVKLPPIPRDSVHKVIISCSPNLQKEECRAMMIYGPENRLAFCWPDHSSEWTPIGEMTKSYEDIIYSPSHKLFFCIAKDHFYLEGWNLGDALCPRMEEKMEFNVGFKKQVVWSKQQRVRQLNYLVLGQESNELYLVVRHIERHCSPWGYYVQSADHTYPYKTLDFTVLKIGEERKVCYRKDSLDGLAMFIGTNHSFSMIASKFAELEGDCIFFTDENNLIPPDWPNLPPSVPDIDIFNYRCKGFYSNIKHCTGLMGVPHDKHGYVCDTRIMKRDPPLPMWFTPTLH